MKLVSIGMPVYNDKPFVNAAIESLLKQTYQNFELIISDDFSTDGSQHICLEAEKNDKRIKYIRQHKNIGISNNMEFLLKEARGEYFMWAGNDDLWHHDFITELVNGLEKTKDSIVAFCNVMEIDEDNNKLKIHDPSLINYRDNTPAKRLKKLIKVFYDGFGYGLFIKKEIVNVKFPVWWWINKKCPYNNIYPTLCFYLTKGNFILCGNKPLWYNRIKNANNINHKMPFPNSSMRGYFAFVLWKFNLVLTSLSQIKRGGGSIFLIMNVSTSMILRWFLLPIIYEFINSVKRLYNGQIKFW